MIQHKATLLQVSVLYARIIRGKSILTGYLHQQLPGNSRQQAVNGQITRMLPRAEMR